MKKIEKKFISVFFALFLLILSAFPVSAADDLVRVFDYADILSDSEEEDLLNKLDEISKLQQMDVAVVTVDSLEGKSAEAYADDFYDEYGYGFGEEGDGILFLLSMREREWHISTKGYAIAVFTDAGLDYIMEKVVVDLKAGEYASAFTTFADYCDDYITQAATGKPYDIDHLPNEPFPFFLFFVVCLVIAFVIALIATWIMKGKLKSVKSRPGADDYIKDGSMKLTKKNDLFLYRHIDRREKPKENESRNSSHSGGSTTHRSSSGATHGGRGGKF